VGRGFTLIELIAVVTLLLVVLGIAVPAFTGMINASQRSLAENSLRAGVTIARDLAVLNGQDSGLLFVRESNGRTRLIPVVRVGTLRDAVRNQNGNTNFDPNDTLNFPTVERDVFAAVDYSSPMQLPKGWAVAGYADAGTIDRVISIGGPSGTVMDGWYDSEAYGDDGMNLVTGATPDPVRDAGHWLLPESDLYEKFMQGPGATPPSGASFQSQVSGADLERTPRQSFMLRFESGTGLLQRGGRPALVLDPRPSSLGRGEFTGAARWLRADRIDDAQAWLNRVLTTADVNSDGVVDATDPSYRLWAAGNFSNDTVLAGTVSRLAIFEEDKLTGGLGASGLNRETGSLYLPIAEEGRIAFDMSLFADSAVITDPEDVRLGITRWIQGDTNFVEVGFANSDTDGDGSIYGDAETANASADQPVARIYFVHPGTGELTEVAR
jgi:prepilin-type N-terminal cleavage/methylation domain-containing protein